MSSRSARVAVGVALLVGVGMRVFNAFAYRHLFGFDARFNWEYIQYLTTTWALPAPGALWSAAHPPFFYYAGAAILRVLGRPGPVASVIVLRLVGTVAGLVTVGVVYAVVRRIAPDRPRRALLAAGLILFLPVHVYMSAMLTEEIVVTCFITLAIALLVLSVADRTEPMGARRALAIGVFCGLALLTKLTGILVAVAVCGALAHQAWRGKAYGPGAVRIAIVVAAVCAIGGWFFLRNWMLYGYLYPHGLDVHRVMYTMPPGLRFVSDYFYLPFAIWTDPQVLNHDLQHSVWGSTYVTVWFDGHRAFLPHGVTLVDRVGGVLLVLGLLPTVAFVVGVVRGARRVVARGSTADVALLLLVGLTLAGYVLFTWRNPFFAVCKASFLLGLSLPFAVYASEVLDAWIERGGWLRAAVSTVLVLLAVGVSLTFTQTRLFWNMDHMKAPGMVWATRDPDTGRIRYK